MHCCPRCHSNMVLTGTGTASDRETVWTCLACGQEVRRHAPDWTDDDLIAERVLHQEGLIVETRRVHDPI